MGNRVSSSVKIKITTSLDAQLVKAIDESLQESKVRSRSKFIEDILRAWHEEQKKRELESQVEKYYLSLSQEERQEDRQWTEITAQSAQHLWRD